MVYLGMIDCNIEILFTSEKNEDVTTKNVCFLCIYALSICKTNVKKEKKKEKFDLIDREFMLHLSVVCVGVHC